MTSLKSLLSAITFTFFCAASLSAQSQSPVSSQTERLSPISGEWEKIQELSFAYNEQGDVVETISKIWDQDLQDWTAFASTSSEYDFSGELESKETKVWDQFRGSWNKVQRVEFDAESKEVYVWNASKSDWEQNEAANRNTAKSSVEYDHTQAVTTSYDAEGNPLESVISSYTSGQTRTMRTVYTYADKTSDLAQSAEISNYPNPVSASTTISFVLVDAADVNIQLFDAQGRVVMEVAQDRFEAGKQEVTFDATDLFAGMYHYNLVVDGEQIASNSMIVL